MNKHEVESMVEGLEGIVAQRVDDIVKMRKLREDLYSGRITIVEVIGRWMDRAIEGDERGLADLRAQIAKLRETVRE